MMAAKAVVLIAALGILSAAANWFCLRSLHEIDRVNATVTEQIEPLRTSDRSQDRRRLDGSRHL